RIILTGFLISAALWCIAGAAAAQQPELSCTAGPINRTFGGSSWMVYGCNDGKSLVVVSDAKNPAAPFLFVLAWNKAGYSLSGEGSGSQAASSGAFIELKALTPAQIESLSLDAQSVSAATKH